MKVKFKKCCQSAVTPTKAHADDAGYDMYATSISVDEYDNIVCKTGIAVEIPKGYVGLLFPRSSIFRKDLMMTNSVGVIDTGYTGQISVKFAPIKNENSEYKIGDRIAQLVIVPLPDIELEEVEELSPSERGNGGYGSTGE